MALSDGYVTIDIRWYMATLTVAMVAAFLAGLGGVENLPSAAALWTTTRQVATVLTATPTESSSSDRYVVRDSFPASPDLLETLETNRSDYRTPAGQHLLVDIEGVEADFLDSEKRLTHAMQETARATNIPMLSYHCHSLLPKGVSCVGVLVESHISFHTWPDEGVITLDFFSCGSEPLVAAVEIIERLFGIPSQDEGVRPLNTRWSHEIRGFRTAEEKKHLHAFLDETSELALWILSPLEMHSKKQVYSDLTGIQRLDIWEIVEVTDTPSYQDILKHNLQEGDPRLHTPELVTPDRIVFTDGRVRLTMSCEQVFYEALAQPALFAHARPAHVAVVQGASGALVREALKHTTIQSVTLVEPDVEYIRVAREALPVLSNCTDYLNRADNCFDDELVEHVVENDRTWFLRNYGAAVELTDSTKRFDVILYEGLNFIFGQTDDMAEHLDALLRSLSEDGVLVIPLGAAATIHDPHPDRVLFAYREYFFKILERNPLAETILVYEEGNSGFLEPRSNLLICRSVQCRKHWYARSDQVEYQIYDRITRTHSKERVLGFFDGTTQRSYQWPRKGWETVYCNRDPVPWECAYIRLDPKAQFFEYDPENEEEGSFRVTVDKDEEDEIKATHVFATEDIPKGSYIMAEHQAASLMVTSRNLEGLVNNTKIGGGRVAIIEDLLEFFDEYGHESAAPGSEQHYIEVGGTVLIRRVPDAGEANIGPWVPTHPSGKRPAYSPVYERHRMSFDVFIVATRDIKEGEEILMYEEMWSGI